MAAIDELTTPSHAQLVSQLVLAVSSCLARSGMRPLTPRGSPPSPRDSSRGAAYGAAAPDGAPAQPFALLLSKIDLADELLDAQQFEAVPSRLPAQARACPLVRTSLSCGRCPLQVPARDDPISRTAAVSPRALPPPEPPLCRVPSSPRRLFATSVRR